MLLGFPGGESGTLEYQVYHKVQNPNPPGIASRDVLPSKRWVRVVVVHKGGVGTLYV